MSTSWKPEVIADSSGIWVGNSLRFATKEESDANVRNLYARWTLVQQTRSVESDEPVNSAWDMQKGELTPLPRSPTPDLVVEVITDANQFVRELRNMMEGGSTGC